MKIEGDYLVLSDGKKYYANNGIVGLSPELELSEGYDGGFTSEMPDAHRREIAEYMIAQWTRVLNGEKPPEGWR